MDRLQIAIGAARAAAFSDAVVTLPSSAADDISAVFCSLKTATAIPSFRRVSHL